MRPLDTYVRFSCRRSFAFKIHNPASQKYLRSCSFLPNNNTTAQYILYSSTANMENSTMIEMRPMGNDIHRSPCASEADRLCYKQLKNCVERVKNSYFFKKVTSLVKLCIAIWVFTDIVSDALQTKKYHLQSSDWNTTTFGTECRAECLEVCRNFNGISGHYFTWAIVTWIMPPFICGLYFYHGIVQRKGGYDRELFFCGYGLGLLINVLAIVLATLVGAVYVYIKVPVDLIRLALFDLGVIPQHWATCGKINILTFSAADLETTTKVFKLFENLGEAAPQLALALMYFVSNQEYVYCVEDQVLGLPTSLISILLSAGSLLMGIVTGLTAGRNMCATTGGLYYASSEGNLEEVKRLLRGGGDPDYLGECLIKASGRGHLEVVKTLLAAGAYKDQADSYGITPLIRASSNGQTEVVNALVDAGANVQKKNKRGQTAFDQACDNAGSRREEKENIQAILSRAGGD